MQRSKHSCDRSEFASKGSGNCMKFSDWKFFCQQWLAGGVSASEQYQLQGIVWLICQCRQRSIRWLEKAPGCCCWRICYRRPTQRRWNCRVLQATPKEVNGFERGIVQRCKYAKERLSIVLCCSAPGEKLKPLVIGNATRPRAFKQNNVTPANLPVTWKHNKKAWMTTAVFEDRLNQLNETMKKKRRIILFVDNATSHVVSKKLSNVHVTF